ncbi:ABC transporter ATP-binding protein [Agrococcus sp. Marseille-Q4369]|uniref:ABC transporter ATP-binding protein n=1 Tax=Agrococcus sp. Marseille-Q4369 TaxID=2810513 RepID=UPI001B8C6F3F|nr:ABC transporter ATP-binding protein [Agrococcus sp. Marseille-Q4369]QUW19262.1 ABC transporter ATP-binding protein [Agrococcus sp. Marseille-Q4369]
MANVLELRDVSFVRNGNRILDRISWSVDEADRWVILGPNGAGKSTILQLAAAATHPTAGEVHVLGERIGKVDVFELRTRIGLAATGLARRIPAAERVGDVVLTAAYAVTGRWREQYESLDLERAAEVMDAWDLGPLATRPFGTLSDGERKRVQIARAVMTDPELMLLDEPAGSLDLGARESLLASLEEYASSPLAPAIVMVTHHVEEIPPGFTHAMLLREGGIVAAGPLDDVLTDARLTETFGIPLAVAHEGGRWSARAKR